MVAGMDKLKGDIVAYLTISLAQIKAGNWLEIEANLERDKIINKLVFVNIKDYEKEDEFN